MEVNLKLVSEDPLSLCSSSSVKADVFDMVEMTEDFLFYGIFFAIFCLIPKSSISLFKFRSGISTSPLEDYLRPNEAKSASAAAGKCTLPTDSNS